ncbi:MAG: acyl-CoA dehydrogenase family protein [Aeromicrobium sp.]
MNDLRDPEAYRTQVREWLAANVPPPSTVTGDAAVERSKAFAQRVYDAGFSGIDVPEAYGGQGLGPAEQQIWREESSQVAIPMSIYDIGFGMCGPIVVALGTEEQKKRYVPPLLAGSEIWCQLFSEPAAGSDVAALRTKAVLDGDEYTVNGQKVWTTGAQFCDYGILLARTNPDVPKHRGITMFIVDMRAPGVTVRPLIDMGGGAHFNEVFFDDVRIPADHVVGEVDKGWDAARLLLSFERLAVSGGGSGIEGAASGPLSFAGLTAAARDAGTLASASAQDDLVDLFLLEHSINTFNERLAREYEAGIDPGARGSIGKLLKGRREVAAAGLTGRLIGDDAVFNTGSAPARTTAALRCFALPIGGGTNEIQLSIIGERVLGLPREPQSDLKTAFRDMDSRRKDV